VGALLVSACEPSGPGSLTATIEMPAPTGAAVVELVGPRVTGFEGLGGTRVFPAPATAVDTVRRVVVVSPGGTSLQFRVDVEDVRADAPRGRVVEAVDPANQRVTSLAGYAVRVAR
jgi:hypothetical protein